MHRREVLEREQLAHAHRAWRADPREIVADQIDDHQVFGAVLRALRQRASERRVVLGTDAARPRALDRPRLEMPGVRERRAETETWIDQTGVDGIRSRPICRTYSDPLWVADGVAGTAALKGPLYETQRVIPRPLVSRDHPRARLLVVPGNHPV